MYDEPIEPQGPPVYDPRLTPEDIAEFERIAAADKKNGRVISAKLVAFGKVKLERVNTSVGRRVREAPSSCAGGRVAGTLRLI